MRFITEFNIEGKQYHGVLASRKATCKWDLATLIEENFGWKNPVNGNRCHHRLEIEAFPMDKWIEFKKRFMDALPDYDSVSRSRLINALAELEQHMHIDFNKSKKPL